MGETVRYPFDKYYEVIISGKGTDIFNATYLKYWVVFLVLSLVLYYMVARGLFTSLARGGARIGFASQAAIVTGLFTVVVAFYLVFMFSPVVNIAWAMEFTLLLAWFLFFIFSWVTAPAAK